MIAKFELDKLVEIYETRDFILEDPIQFPHKYKRKSDIELSAFIASLFAYGSRKVFINKLNEIFIKTENDLTGFIKNGDFNNLRNIEYRFSKDFDIIAIFNILHILYNESKGLEELFKYAYKNNPDNKQTFLQTVVDYFYSRAPKTASNGFYHMIPNPKNGGAMKRMNMFLRWLVRSGPVDLGIWKFMEPKDLMIPLDVHVARVSRDLGLLTRKSNDFRAVQELTDQLKIYCPEDPIKYDFAMFAFGVELNKK